MAGRLQLYKLAYRSVNAAKYYSFPIITRHVCRQYEKSSIFPWNKEFRRNLCTVDRNELPISQEANHDGNGKSDGLQTFSTLKMKQERLGPLNINDIKKGIKDLEKQSGELKDEDFLQLLQLTLSTVENEYKMCAGLVQEVWHLSANRKDTRLTLQHLELYFQMCLLAEVPVSCKTMLSLVENHGIEISRELLEVMMLIIGRQGKLDDATNMLTFMKQRNIPITEVVFSALILAHGFSRNIDGLNSVLDTMHNIQMDFTSTTYHALMTAYAVSGNFAKVKSVVSQMNRAKVVCTHNQLKSLLMDLVKNNEAGEDFENMDFILGLMEVNQEVMDLSTVVLHLIHCGHVREAVKLLSSHPPVERNKEFYNNARIYIQEMVHAVKEPDLLVDMCRQLQQDEINKYALLVALETALTERREEIVWELLKAVKEDEKPLRQHYFWPLFNSSQSIKSSKVLENVQNMVKLGIPPDLSTLRDYIIPGLSLRLPISIELMLKETGLAVSQIATPLLIVLIKNNMMDKALDYARNTKVAISLHEIMAPLARAWVTSPQTVISLLALLIQKSKVHATSDVEADWGGQFLLDITASRGGLNKHQIVPLFEELRKNDIGISENSADHLVARANESIQETLKDNINIILDKKLGQPPKEQEYNFMPHPSDMNIDELEGHLVELQTKGFKTRGTLRRLILLHAAQNNTERVMKLLKVFEESGEKLSPGILASILDTYVSAGNVDAALNIYQSLKEDHPSFVLDCYKLIDLCTILLDNGETAGAIKILEVSLVLEGNKNCSRKQVRRNCRELLMAAARTCNYEVTKRIFDILKSRNIIEVENLTLGPLVKCRLNSGDLSGTVEEVRNIFENFKLLPMRVEVLIHLLHNRVQADKNAEAQGTNSSQEASESADKLLEDMLDIIAKSNGSLKAQHDLLFACVEAGYPNAAKQVLKNLGKKIDKVHIRHQCNRYAKTSREEPLLHLLTASKANVDANREEIFRALLNLFYVQNDGNKGLSLWIRMQEEDVSPSRSFLGALASLLAANNIKIPFKVPQSV